MFSFKPNPDYVPGGINNFWLSGSSVRDGPPNREVKRPHEQDAEGRYGGSGGAMEGAVGSGYGAGMRNTHEKDGSQKSVVKEFVGLKDSFTYLGNTYVQ